jgi:RNA polymerase sigma-70 factor (ECF subfamily)
MDKSAEIIELARRARDGDKKALSELCEKKMRSIINNAKSMLGNVDDAMDICSETMFSMFKGIEKLRDPEAVDVWVLRITQHLCVQLLAKRDKYILANADSNAFIDIYDNDSDFLPEQYTESKELSRAMVGIIEALPPARREAVILYYYNGLSYDEIAKQTGKTIKTVSTNLMKARRTIREKILEEYPEMADRNRVCEHDKTAIVIGLAASAPENVAAVAKVKGFALFQTHKPNLALKVATATIGGVSIAVTAVYGIIHQPQDRTSALTQISAVTHEYKETYKSGEIVFISSIGDDNHVDPADAKLEGLAEKYESIEWSIIASNGKIISLGQGDEPGAALTSLNPGVYTLKYSILYPGGFKTYKEREFKIL